VRQQRRLFEKIAESTVKDQNVKQQLMPGGIGVTAKEIINYFEKKEGK